MKKKLITFLTLLILCATLAVGFVGCKKPETPPAGEDGRVNWLETVLEPVDGHMDNDKLVSHYAPNGSVMGWGAEYIDGYSLNDLKSDTLPFNNYFTFGFWWKSNSYRITKIEFDLTAESYYKTNFVLNNPRVVKEQEIELQAGETKQVTINCDIKRDTGYVYLCTDCASDAVMREVKIKISNLFITAEKI